MHTKTSLSPTTPDTADVFDAAFAWLLRFEGVDADHPADEGGRTRYGISQSAYPDVDIDALTLTQAREIYYRDYWLPSGCPQLPDIVAALVFGAAVHHGVFRAVRLLQAAVGAKQDGLLGPRTRSAVHKKFSVSPQELVLSLQVQRALFMHSIVVSTPSQQVFLQGWLRRLFIAHQAAVVELERRATLKP